MSSGIGPKREEIWQRFAQEIGGSYMPGDFWQSEQVVARLDPWTVTMTLEPERGGTGGFACTRLFAPYVGTNGLTFSIFRTGAFQNTGPLAEHPEITVGDDVFDHAFHVVGSDPDRVRELLQNPYIRQYLLRERQIGLEVTVQRDAAAGHKPGLSQLICVVIGSIEEPERLLGLFELMGETLQHLRALGSAADTDPTKFV